ncbi:hypothetical protein JCM19233_2678 [Vibrio astriarenae]|nr:hypothetical protein JCM19233_2678 [Vibrio sp. C7]
MQFLDNELLQNLGYLSSITTVWELGKIELMYQDIAKTFASGE